MTNESLALSCAGLYKRYGSHQVLQGLELAVNNGSIHGLVGLNGAGKTTTLECLLGLRRFEKGDIRIAGYSPDELFRAQGKVAVVFDSPCLHAHLTVQQTLEFACLTNRQHAMDIQEVQRLLGIERYRHFKIKQLSLGNRRRTSIAQALIHRPDFMILDEPFNGLDAGGVDDVLKLLAQLNREYGTSFLLASHQLSYLEKICTHMAILHQGKICLNQSLQTLLSQDQSRVELQCGDPNQARIVLSQIPGISLINDQSQSDPAIIQCQLNDVSSAELNAKLVSLGIAVEQLILRKPTLEAIFYRTIEEAAS